MKPDYTECIQCKHCLGITYENNLICAKIDCSIIDKQKLLKYCINFEKNKRRKENNEKYLYIKASWI